jgi:hypothetical protein
LRVGDARVGAQDRLGNLREFRNINFSNCAVRDAGCGIGLWMRDGGLIDGWVVNNISMTLTGGGQPIYMTSYPRSRLSEPGSRPEPDRPPGVVRNVMISNVTAEADGCIFLSGMEERPLEGITLENIRIHMRGGREKKLLALPHPFGATPSPYDIFCRGMAASPCGGSGDVGSRRKPNGSSAESSVPERGTISG